MNVEPEKNKLWFVCAQSDDGLTGMDLFVYAQDMPTAARLWQTYYRDWPMPAEIVVMRIADAANEDTQRAVEWEDLIHETVSTRSILNYGVQ